MKEDKLPHRKLSEKIIGAAITVHRAIGPGLLESIYERALEIELCHVGLKPKRQVPCPIMYRGQDLGIGHRLDIVVNNSVCIEIKAVERIMPVHSAQLLSYLHATGLQVGFLLNFNAPTLKDGLTRKVLQYTSASPRLRG
jgi:GxxExxY protein